MTAKTGPSQSMVEKVRDAICAASANFISVPLHRLIYEDMARAAIEAMREPTEAMGLAGGIARRNWNQSVWDAMISAALSEGK
jgi:hypothetical protein